MINIFKKENITFENQIYENSINFFYEKNGTDIRKSINDIQILMENSDSIIDNSFLNNCGIKIYDNNSNIKKHVVAKHIFDNYFEKKNYIVFFYDNIIKENNINFYIKYKKFINDIEKDALSIFDIIKLIHIFFNENNIKNENYDIMKYKIFIKINKMLLDNNEYLTKNYLFLYLKKKYDVYCK